MLTIGPIVFARHEDVAVGLPLPMGEDRGEGHSRSTDAQQLCSCGSQTAGGLSLIRQVSLHSLLKKMNSLTSILSHREREHEIKRFMAPFAEQHNGQDKMRRAFVRLTLLLACARAAVSCSTPTRESVRDIALTRISIQQGVELTLMQDAHEITPPYAAPIAGRSGVLHVEFEALFTGTHDVTAVLELDNAGGTSTKELVRKVYRSNLAQSVNFELAASDLQETTSFRVRFVNTEGASSGEGAPAEYPPTTAPSASLKVQKSGSLRIKLIPVRYDYDGSGRVADSGPVHVEELRTRFLDLYPVTSVAITVGEPLPWSKNLSPNGDGHDDLLDAIVALRAQERPEDDVYYLGLFATTATYAGYCGKKCTTGLSLRVKHASQAESRASVAVGYAETRTMDTSLHEIGHAHGREHAPCGVTSSDAAYPHEKARLGSQGYSASTKVFYDPALNYDFMSYCDPAWVSDYTFGALLTRVQEVAALSVPQQGLRLPRQMRMLQARPHGTSKWGPKLPLAQAPTGDPISIDATAPDGLKTIVVGYKYSYQDRTGGYALIPSDDVKNKTVTLDFDGAKITLDREN